MQTKTTCDNCKKTELSNEIIWITSDDFTPLENEIVPEYLYEKYDALCEPCYLSLISGGHETKNCTCTSCSAIS